MFDIDLFTFEVASLYEQLVAGPEKYREHGSAAPRKVGICQEGKAPSPVISGC